MPCRALEAIPRGKKLARKWELGDPWSCRERIIECSRGDTNASQGGARPCMLGPHCAAAQPADGPIAEWSYYSGDAGGSRYSELIQITKANVAGLTIAWE